MPFVITIISIILNLALASYPYSSVLVVQIDSSPTRGMTYIDAQGRTHGFVYVTSTIKNTGKESVEVAFNVDKEQFYPSEYDSHPFKLLIWPGISSNEVTPEDSLGNLTINFSAAAKDSTQNINKIIYPGENYQITMGTLFERSLVGCSVVAYKLLEYLDDTKHKDCDWGEAFNPTGHAESALGIMLGYCTTGGEYKSCKILSCGKLKYTDG